METVMVVDRFLAFVASCRRRSDRPEVSRIFTNVEESLNWLQEEFPNSTNRRIEIFDHLKVKDDPYPYTRKVAEFHWLELFPGTKLLDQDPETTDKIIKNRARFLKITGFDLNRWMSQNTLPDFNTNT